VGGTDRLAVLLGEFVLAVLLQQLNVWSLLTVSTCFIGGQVFHKKTNWVRGITWYRIGVWVRRGKKNWKTKQEWGAVDKEISLLFLIDKITKINRVNYQC
jgi:hypothetical protein